MSGVTTIFERDDNIYIVAPVHEFAPGDEQQEEFAFTSDMRKMAPNEHLLWLQGRYVEADRPNENGAEWPEHELEFASLTPMLMPVTVMHDPRTAVGLIADLKLQKADTAAGIPRTRIDDVIAVWSHRFPAVAEEVAANHRAGTLMQSMECRPAFYDCGDCGRRFPKLPGGAEKRNWCEHLRGEVASAGNRRPVRRLGNVTFTGTGLIFGTRGARGAYDEAHLDVLQDEIAEFHERAKREPTRKRSKSRMGDNIIEITRDEYATLQAAKAELDQLKPRVQSLTETAAKVPDLETKLEQTEAAKVKAEGERDEKATALTALEETAREADLAKKRLDVLTPGFKGKLGEHTRSRVEEQAAKLSDEDWEARIVELEEMAGVKRDFADPNAAANGANGAGGDGTFSREETARAGAGNNGGNGGDGGAVTQSQRRGVIGGLAKAAKARA